MLWLVCLQGVGQLRLQRKETQSLTNKKCDLIACFLQAACDSSRRAIDTPVYTLVSV